MGRARTLFGVMAQAFEEPCSELDDAYIEALLSNDDFWVYAAVVDEGIVGGITGHTLPMTRSQSHEIFIYDLAVNHDFRRQGIARGLVQALRRDANAKGIDVSFVPVDVGDEEALSFYRSTDGVESKVVFFVYGE